MIDFLLLGTIYVVLYLSLFYNLKKVIREQDILGELTTYKVTASIAAIESGLIKKVDEIYDTKEFELFWSALERRFKKCEYSLKKF